MPPTPPKPSQLRSPGFNKSFREIYFGDLDEKEGERRKRKLVFTQFPKDGSLNRSLVNGTQNNGTQNNHHNQSTQRINSTYNSSMVSSPPPQPQTASTSSPSNWRTDAEELLEKANDTYRENPSDRLHISPHKNDPKVTKDSPMRAGQNSGEEPTPHPAPVDEIKLVPEHLEDNDDVGISWDISRDHHIDSDG